MKKILISIISVIISVTCFSQNEFSLLFGGSLNHEVIIPANSNFDDVTDSVTICAWIKPINILAGGEGSAIIGRRDYVAALNGERTHFMFGVKDDLSLRFISGNNTNPTLYSFQAITGDSVVNYGVWNFVCVTFNKGIVKMYVDGNLVYNINHGVKEMFPYNHLISIGKIKRTLAGNSFAQFGGLLDEISIWHDDLSDSLINQYMTCPPTGNEPELLAYWKFEEGINLTANDETSNSNDGSIGPGTQWFTDVPTKYCTCNTSLYPTYDINRCDSTVIHGITYYTSQTVIDTVPGTFGCDSIVTTNLTMNFLDSTTIDTTIAHNQTLYVGGEIQNSSGTYYDKLKTSTGCDSIVITNLTMLPMGINSKVNNVFSFYPNPTNGRVVFNSKEKGYLSIFTVQGQIINDKEIVSGMNEFDISDLLVGTYILKFNSISGVSSSLLIKE